VRIVVFNAQARERPDGVADLEQATLVAQRRYRNTGSLDQK